MAAYEKDTAVAASIGKYKLVNVLLVVVLVCTLLYMGRKLLIPLSFAVFISCILYPICRWLERKGLSPALSIALSMLLITVLFGGVLILLVYQISSFTTEWPSLQSKLTETFDNLTAFISSRFNITLAEQEIWWNKFSNDSGSKVLPLLQTTLGSIAESLAYLILIPILSAMILHQRRQLFSALQHFTNNISQDTLRSILEDTINTYYNFIKGMALVYIVVGLLNSIGLMIIGVPHAFLFGFIAAVLTFIPYIGILIGAMLPMVVSWITFNSLWYPAGVILVFTIVQYLEANIIFPWAVSSKLSINTLATVIAILAGGLLWGSAGMILFVPFVGILKLLSDRTKGMEAISALLDTKAKPVPPKS